jgi:malate:Na+ symporter
LARILPAVVMANLLAVLVGGTLARWSARGAKHESLPTLSAPSPASRIPAARRTVFEVSCAAMLLIAVYSCGVAAHRWLNLPASLVILVVAAILQLLIPLPVWLTGATAALYRRFIQIFTYPLLLAVGLLLMPWQELVDSVELKHVLVLAITVGTLALIGAITGRWVGLAPSDSALITLTRAAMGGSGDVAILNAAGRMDLMPFAQIATRVGGALTLALTLLYIG